jgi:hypothetical protein
MFGKLCGSLASKFVNATSLSYTRDQVHEDDVVDDNQDVVNDNDDMSDDNNVVFDDEDLEQEWQI